MQRNNVGLHLGWLNENAASIGNLVVLVTALFGSWVTWRVNSKIILNQKEFEERKYKNAELEHNRKKQNLVKTHLADYWKLARTVKMKYDNSERCGFPTEQYPEDIIELILLGNKIRTNLIENSKHDQEIISIIKRMNEFSHILFNIHYNNIDFNGEMMTTYKYHKDNQSNEKIKENFKKLHSNYLGFLTNYIEDMIRIRELTINYCSD